MKWHNEPERQFPSLNLTVETDGFPDSAAINGIRTMWETLRQGERLPARRDVGMDQLAPWLGIVSLVEVHSDPRRFKWRLIGSEITRRMGRDATGRWFDELYEPGVLEGYERNYSLAVDAKVPMQFRGDLEFVGKEFLQFKAIHLPLASNGVDVDMLLLLLDFS